MQMSVLGAALDADVAVAAVDAQLAGVQRVAVGNRLLGLVADCLGNRRGGQERQHDDVEQPADGQQARQPRERVHPAWK